MNTLHKQADALLKECALLLFSGKCAFYKDRPAIECAFYACDPHHIEERNDKSLRWHILNVLPLCRLCHNWAHENPTECLAMIEEILPDYYAFYEENRNSRPEVITPVKMRETIEELKALKHHLITNDPRRYTQWQKDTTST